MPCHCGVCQECNWAKFHPEVDEEENRITALETQLIEEKRLREAAERFIQDAGYVRCDISACNCSSWHGGHWHRRFNDIQEAVEEAGVSLQGVTLLDAVKGLLAAREKAEANVVALAEAVKTLAYMDELVPVAAKRARTTDVQALIERLLRQ